MAKSFDELVNTPADEIKPPPLLPVGTYLVGIMGPAEQITSTQKQTPGYAFKYKFFQARDDVDRDQLTNALEEGNMALSDMEMTDTFYITDRSLHMFKEFYEKALGLKGMTPKQAAAEASGRQLLVHVRHVSRKRNDGEMYLAPEIDTRTRAPE
jgi:hypothetical protein